MKQTILTAFLLFLTVSVLQSQELSVTKMKTVTKEVIELFIKSNPNERLRDYISEDWLDSKKINVKQYKINYYSPKHYEIIMASGNMCVATIGGSSWKHLLVFKFTEEFGKYKLIPKGISKVTGEYIDPWWEAYEYICDTSDGK